MYKFLYKAGNYCTMRTVMHFMGMKSTKYGGLEKFIIALIHHNPSLSFVLVYDDYPSSSQYIADLIQNNAIIEVVDFKSMGVAHQFRIYRELLYKYNPDIVHFHFSYNHIGALSARLHGVKKIYKTVHSCLIRNNVEIESYRQLGIKQRINFFCGIANRLYSAILFVSDFTYNQYVKVFGPSSSYRRIYWGVEQRHGAAVQMPKEVGDIPYGFKVITTIAFAHPLKGVDVLIRAMPEIEDAIFIIIGLKDCDYTRELQQLADQLGVGERIRWIGIIDDIYPYLLITNIYVQPSRTEALSLAACEALSLGIPVIASNVGGLHEVSSIVFDNENYHQLSHIANELLKDSILYKQLSDNCLTSFRQKFNMLDAVKSYTNIYLTN